MINARLETTAYAALVLGALLACKGGSSSSESTPAGPPVAITATDLHAAYQVNEVAADEKYKGKRLFVTGRISSIDKDAFDNMVIRLATNQMLQDAMATMKDDAKSVVATLVKGQPVTLDCTGAGLIIGSPSLSDCAVLKTAPSGSAKPPAAKK